MQYEPGKFASDYESGIGKRLWTFLTKPENIIRLEAASELGKPAVEGMAGLLLKEFREAVSADRTKQMIGHMVRQIMEENGWILDQSNVTVRSFPFIKASRYRRPNWRTLYAYRNSKNARDIAITARRHNPPLPSKERWIYYTALDSSLKAAVFVQECPPAELAQKVRDHGFYRIRQVPILGSAG